MARVLDIRAYHYQDDRSDKVWGYALVEEDSGNVVTIICHGRRGARLIVSEKGPSYGANKIGEKMRKGYIGVLAHVFGITQALADYSPIVAEYEQERLARTPPRLVPQNNTQTEQKDNETDSSQGPAPDISKVDLGAGIVMLESDPVDEETEE